MRKGSIGGFGLVVVAILTNMASAHTGTGAGSSELNPTDIDIVSLVPVTTSHTEDPTKEYKGWWWITIKNSTSTPWTAIKIEAAGTDKVAIVEGIGLKDDDGVTGDSVISTNNTGNWAYSISRGTGTRDYGGGVTGNLWKEVVFTPDTAIANGQNVKFRVYTDNSWYSGPFADSFSLKITVPEPATIGVLALGGGALLLRRRRAA